VNCRGYSGWMKCVPTPSLSACSGVTPHGGTANVLAVAADKPISYVGYRFPPEVISYAVWLYFRFLLSLRMVEEMLAARGIEATYETVRRWALKFGASIARRIRSNAPACGDKWHLDEVMVTINGQKHWLWRTVDQHGAKLDVLVQSRRDQHAARRLMRKLMKKHGRVSHVLVTDKLRSYAAANRDLGIDLAAAS
jgi:putative transposase